MNRREFLKRMGLAGLVVAAPKIIFDMGAHSWCRMSVLNPAWESAQYEEILLYSSGTYELSGRIVSKASGVILHEPMLFPRRFEQNSSGVMVEVPVFLT